MFEPINFFKTIFGEGQGYVELRLISNGDKRTQTFIPVAEFFEKWPEIAEKLKTANRSANIYYGVNLRTEKIGDAAHIKECRALWADIDYTDAELLKKNCAPLHGFNLDPSIVVDTGHGYHFYWTLSEPIDPADAEKIMRKLARVLCADSVYDPPRVLRVPGTTNIKGAPVPCEVIRSFADRVFNSTDFDALDTVAAGTPPPKAAAPAPTPLPATATMEKHGNGHGFVYSMARAVARFWRSGMRHNLTLGVAGLLRRDEVKEEDAVLVIQKVMEIAGDNDVEDRVKAVRTTYAKPGEVASSSIIEELLRSEANHFFKSYNAVVAAIPPPPIKRTRFPEFKLYDCIPAGSVFDKYVMLGNNLTDAPLQFHVASAITLGAAALGNRVYVKFHGKKLYSTLYSLVVGPSSRYRKSTSVMQGYRVGKVAEVKAYPNNATPEQLYAEFCPDDIEHVNRKTGEPCAKGDKDAKAVAWEGRPAGIIYHPEFTKFLDTSAKSYMADSRSMMMDFYDGFSGRDISSRKTKTSGRYYVEDPAVSLLCGVTPLAMKNFCSRLDMGSGFLSRFFIVMNPPDHRNRFEWYNENPADLDLINDIGERFRMMTLVSGEIDPTDEAKKLYLDFERFLHKKMEEYEGTQMGALDPFLARLGAMAVKIAVVFAHGLRSPATRVEVEEMQYSINLCTYAALVLEHFFDAIKPEERNPEVGFKNTVLTAVRGFTRKYKTDRIPHRALLQAVNLDSAQVARALDSLVDEGRVARSKTSTGRGVVYVLNEVEE